jgi:hypothetical protein
MGVGAAADLAVGFTPAGVYADIYAATTGKTLFDGQELSWWERGLGLIPGASEFMGVVRGAKTADRIADVGVAERRVVAESYYREAGLKESAIADHIRGIDFTRPVEIVTVPRGTELIQYQIPGAPVGNYFALPGTPGNQLGIYTSGREASSFVATGDVRALRSTAAGTIDDWSMKAYGWKIETLGGGTQFHSPSNMWTPK